MTGGTNGDDELSLKDITFLRAIRDINGSPERYGSTEQGVTPATVTAITEATTLSEEEVASRLDHPRLGNGGLVTVYEAGPPGDDSASLNSAELTEAGERAIAEAEGRERAADGEEWHSDEAQSEFDEMQEWEPADVESGSDAARTTEVTAGSPGGTTARASADPMAAPPTESPDRASTSDGVSAGTDDSDRVAALEARIERLEAETADADSPSDSTAGPTDDGRVDDLAEEVAALRETTDRLEATLDEALDELDAIRESEYGALDEKREAQFETAVKSMVAFHQLATEVLDVRVENYEPAAGHADPERVEITRNRIGDALGVGQSGGGGGRTLETNDDGEWPDPEEAARGGRVFSGDEADDEPETESDAPDAGVYPPIGGDDSDREAVDEEDTTAPDEGSDAPESGVYPPIGENEDDETDREPAEEDTSDEVPESGAYPPIGENEDDDTGDDPESGEPALPESIRPDTVEGSITDTAAEEGHVVDPIRSTDGDEPDAGRLRIDFDPGVSLTVRRAVVDGDGGDAAAAEIDDPWLLGSVDPAGAREVRDAVLASNDDAASEPPEGEAYARIVGEPSTPAAAGRSADPVSADDDG